MKKAYIMGVQHIFNFKTDISTINIPEKLNNPFSLTIPTIGRMAAQEFQEIISKESPDWDYDFNTMKGKMFGILVIQKEDNSYAYLATVSGKLPGNHSFNKFTPALFDESSDDNFMSKGLTELTSISNEIKKAIQQEEIKALKQKRKKHSIDLQNRLFEQTQLLTITGKQQNVLQIFKNSEQGYPPAAAGECAAPKLLQYAFTQRLKPIAMAEFWWGNTPKSNEREHKGFYPACKDKCRPILEYMLDDTQLFNQAGQG